MSPASSSEVKLEIGHVLFIDIVGYSKLLITEQSERLQKLKEIVWGTEQFRRAQASETEFRIVDSSASLVGIHATVENSGRYLAKPTELPIFVSSKARHIKTSSGTSHSHFIPNQLAGRKPKRG